jgi:hypothetical protein
VGVKLSHLLVSGPPGSGKTALVTKLRGWPEEGYLDLTHKGWWKNRLLTFRPREVHFGFPFQGHRESHAVFDDEWLATLAPIDFSRVRLPPCKRHFFNVDWRARFVFDIQLLPADRVYGVRRRRLQEGTHPVDRGRTRTQVEHQQGVYEALATLLHSEGFFVIVRQAFDGPPLRIDAPVRSPEAPDVERRANAHDDSP